MLEKTPELLAKAENLLKPFALTLTNPDPIRLDARITPDQLIPSMNVLLLASWGYLSAITGLDHPGTSMSPEEEKQWKRLSTDSDQSSLVAHEGLIELLYHFVEGEAIVTLRVNLPYSNPKVPTICGLIPIASLYERELIEMFGITIEGTPNTDHLLLTDDWPQGIYPLRKSFTGLEDKS
jgi:NADH:ubiquinone oxidoreductase subunit C